MEKSPYLQIKMEKNTKNFCNSVAKHQNKLINRLFDTLKSERISVPAFSIETGIPKDRVYKWRQEGTNPKADDERVIIGWLNSLEKVPHETKRYNRFDAKMEIKEGIPIYEASPATLSNIPSYRDSKMDQPDFWITIPQLRDCNYGTRAKGDSMHPLIRTNALVIGREILDLKVIVFGEIYIVHTKNGIETVKYVHQDPTDPHRLLLVPYNEKAKTTPIHKEDILRLYEAKAVFNTI